MPSFALAYAVGTGAEHLDLTNHWVDWSSIDVFVVACTLVMTEELAYLRQSKPAILAASIV